MVTDAPFSQLFLAISDILEKPQMYAFQDKKRQLQVKMSYEQRTGIGQNKSKFLSGVQHGVQRNSEKETIVSIARRSI